MTQSRAIVPPGGVQAKKNATGSDIEANVFVMLDSTTNQIKLPTGTTVALYGVTMAAIENGYSGDIQTAGVALVKASAALATPGIQLMSNTDGKAVTWAAVAGTNAQLAGQLLNTAAALDDLVEVDLRGLGALQQG